MNSKIKNIIIFIIIVGFLVFAYFFFIKKNTEDTNLTYSGFPDSSVSEEENSELITRDFLTILLSVKSIRLNDQIFSENAFKTLKDSSIILISSEDEGRLNPFAPIGYESLVKPVSKDETNLEKETEIKKVDSENNKKNP